MEPLHLHLLHQLYFEAFDMQKLLLYIEESQIGDHFDYNCFQYCKDNQVIVDLYNNNETFRNFVNKKDKRTILFFTHRHIPEIFSIFTEEDFEKYRDIFYQHAIDCVNTCCKFTRPQYNILNTYVSRYAKHQQQMKIYNYLYCILDILTIEEQNKWIKWFIKYRLNEYTYNHLLKLNITEENKNLLQKELFVKKIDG